MQLRIGQGIDVHRLVKGRKLILGGVEIEFEMGLEGHSDADVLLHSICDALLGALSLGDIGKHFPDTDKKWKDVSSLVLLGECKKLVAEAGWKVTNIDCCLLLEKPKIISYVSQMQENIATTLEIEASSCSIKASTAEQLGFIGRGEGVLASAVALLQYD